MTPMCSLQNHRSELIQAAFDSGAEIDECEVFLKHLLGPEAVPDLEEALERWIHTGKWDVR